MVEDFQTKIVPVYSSREESKKIISPEPGVFNESAAYFFHLSQLHSLLSHFSFLQIKETAIDIA